MKNILLIIFLAYSFPSFAQSFEGLINLEITNEKIGEKTAINWYKKGNNHRLEMNTRVGESNLKYTLIQKENDPQMYMLADVEGRKSQYKIPLSSINTSLDLALIGAKELSSKKGIEFNGFTCNKIEIANHQAIVTYWETTDIKLTSEDFPHFLQQANYMKFLEKKQKTTTPIKIISANADGEVEFTQTIVKATATKVAMDKFEVSSDYKLME